MLREKQSKEKKNVLQINLKLDLMDLLLVVILVLLFWNYCVYTVGYSRQATMLPSLGTKIIPELFISYVYKVKEEKFCTLKFLLEIIYTNDLLFSLKKNKHFIALPTEKA